MRAHCSWLALRCCSTGRSAALCGAISRSATRSIISRKNCCRSNQATSNVTSLFPRSAPSCRRARAHHVQDRSDRVPDAAEIAAINATHFADSKLSPADLLFVFGTREDAELRAEKAFALWREGLCRWAID